MKLDLSRLGFRAIGESWVLETTCNQVAVIAIGGKFSHPGELCRTVCVRALCMRTAQEVVPSGFAKEPLDYPIKLSPTDVLAFDSADWNYTSTLLQSPRGYLTCQEECDKLAAAIQRTLLPWVETLDRSVWLEQISANGQDGWIERMWIEDLASNNRLVDVPS